MQVYKAIDSMDGRESIFTVFEDGHVNVSPVMFSDEREVAYIKEWCHALCLEDNDRTNDMVNPVLLAEW